MGIKKKSSFEKREEVPSKKIKVDTLLPDSLNVLTLLEKVRNKQTYLKGLEDLASEGSSAVKEFLSSGGRPVDVLSGLEGSEKAKTNVVIVVFKAAETLILYAPSSFALEIVRRILHDHIRYVIIHLSTNSAPEVNKVTLRLLTAIVASGREALGKEVLMTLDFDQKCFDFLVNRRILDVRVTYVYFLLSFLVSCSGVVLKEFLIKAGKRLVSVFSGLKSDPSDLVILFFGALKDKFLLNRNISKTLKMKLFNTKSLKDIANLLKNESGWSGPEKNDNLEEEREDVHESIHNFLISAFTCPKTGVIFTDESVGNSGHNYNNLLLNFLKSLENPWENQVLQDVVVASLTKSPDQLRPYLMSLTIAPPRESQGWFSMINFFMQIFDNTDWESKILINAGNNKIISSILSNVACPEILVRDVIKPALSSASLAVKRSGLSLLHSMLVKIQSIVERNEKELINASVKSQITYRIKQRVPSLDNLIELWNKEKENPCEKGKFLSYTAQLFDFYWSFLKYECEIAETLLIDVQKIQPQTEELGKAAIYFLKQLSSSDACLIQKFSTKYINLLLKISLSLDNESLCHLALLTLYRILGVREGFIDKFLELEVLVYVAKNSENATELLTDLFGSMAQNRERLTNEIGELTLRSRNIDTNLTAPQTGTYELALRFFDEVIESDDYSNIISRTIGKRSATSGDKLDLSFLTFSLIKSPDIALWSHDFIQKLMYTHDRQDLFCEFILNSSEHLKTKALAKAVLNRRVDSLDDEDTVEVDSIRGFVLLTKIRLSLKNGKAEEKLVLKFSEVLRSSISSRKLLLFESQYIKELFNPYSELHSLTSKIILDSLKLSRKENLETFKNIFLSSIKSSYGLQRILPSLLKQCLETFKFSDQEVVDIFSNILSVKAIDNEFWLLHIAELLRIFPLTARNSLDEYGESIFEVLENVVCNRGTNNNEAFLEAYIIFFNKFFEFTLKYLKTKPLITKCLNEKNVDEFPTKFLTFLVTQDINSSAKTFRKALSNDPTLLASKSLDLLRPLVSAIKNGSKLKFIKNVVLNSLKDKIVKALKGEEKTAYLEIVTAIVDKFPNLDIPSLLTINFSEDDRPNMKAIQCLLLMINNSVPTKTGASMLVPYLKVYTNLIRSPSQPEEVLEDFDKFSYLKASDGKRIMRYVLKNNESFWNNFVRNTLKYCLKVDCVYKSRIRGLSQLAILLEFAYEKEHPHINLIYDMIRGHSNFLKILLCSSEEDSLNILKTDMLKLITTILKISPKIVNAEQIPLYLGAYGGTLSPSDRYILAILRYHENEHSFDPYQPLVWGQFAISRYKIVQNSSENKNLWKIPKSSDILGVIDSEKMYKSALKFPINLPFLEDGKDCKDLDCRMYDPRFFLPLISQICSPGSFIDKHVKLLETGVFAMVLSSLSSKDETMRASGYAVLSRIYTQFESASINMEKKIWLHLIEILRRGALSAKSSKIKYLRIPSIVSVFLVKAIWILKNPLDPMYKRVSLFILAKPSLNLFSVPEFLRLFHSVVVDKELAPRKWILKVISEGLKDSLDYSVLQKDHVLKYVMSIRGTCLSDEDEYIYNVVESCLRIQEGAFDLIRNHGLLLWCSSSLSSIEGAHKLVKSSWQTISSAKALPNIILSQYATAIKGALKIRISDDMLNLLKDVVEHAKKKESDISLLTTRELNELNIGPENMNAFNEILKCIV